MIEVDCRKCVNYENDACRAYGKDPVKAVKSCAARGFFGYWKKNEPVAKQEGAVENAD